MQPLKSRHPSSHYLLPLLTLTAVAPEDPFVMETAGVALGTSGMSRSSSISGDLGPTSAILTIADFSEGQLPVSVCTVYWQGKCVQPEIHRQNKTLRTCSRCSGICFDSVHKMSFQLQDTQAPCLNNCPSCGNCWGKALHGCPPWGVGGWCSWVSPLGEVWRSGSGQLHC